MPIVKVVLAKRKREAFAADHFPGFGTVLRPTDPVEDTDGVAIHADHLKAIRLDPKFPKVPARLAFRVSALYVEMLKQRGESSSRYTVDSNKEVSVVYLRDTETNSLWRVLVPTQVVGGASVNADYEQPLCDIETGEEVKPFPPEGWAHAGSSHSHNTMSAFFSGTDDRNELPVPGIHYVCGSFRKVAGGEGHEYDVAPSIVYQGKRYEHVIDAEDGKIRKMHWTDLLCFDREEGTDYAFHPNVLNYVKVEKPPTWDDSGFSRMRGAAGSLALAYDADEYAGFGYGLDEIEDMEEWSDEKWEKWLEAYEQAETTGRGYARPTPKGVVFVLGYDMPQGVGWDDVKDLPTIWGRVQDAFGSNNVAERLVRYRAVQGGSPIYIAPIYGTGYTTTTYYPVEPIQAKSLAKHAKKQRRSGKLAERNTKVVIVETEPIEFVTRGVSSQDFTQGEIESMIDAWCSNLRQRADVLIAWKRAVRKYQPNGKAG